MITLICGLPNSGKTTLSKQYKNAIHLDDYPFGFVECNEVVRETDGDICVEGVYNTIKRRLQFLESVKDRTDKKVCIWVKTPIDVCIARENRNRTKAVVESQAKSFEPPTLDEGWDEIIIMR